MKIIDNFLEPYYFDYLSDCVNNQSFQWKYQKNVSTFSQGDDGWLHGLSHGLYDPQYGMDFQTEKSEIWIPVILKIEQDLIGSKASLLRARLDMTVKSPPGTIHTPHQDLKQPHWTTIFYLNDADGDTVIYNETERSDNYTIKDIITPKKNRIICFDGSHFHTGHSPSKCSNRILMNSNFIK